MNWGALYEYMVVLDADSLMTAATLTRLVDIMDANPRAALIQVAPMLVGGESLFARSQQFASWVYGRVYAAGLAKLQGPDGNYWGHNAIIRVTPFMQHCGLPVLPGRPPLGGEIMSHDFVEAALLRRAGWDVWLTTELGGSYEASPPTLIDHLKRDRRWCQGNLQHVKLLFAEGFRAQSRLHLAFGAMSYLSSPLWLMLIVLFFSYAVQLEGAKPVTYVGRYPILSWPISHSVTFVGLVLATAVLLYAPKFIAAVLVLRDAARARAHGGVRGVLTSLLAESMLSTLLAPVMMLSHSWFVLSALIGRSVGWGSQKRGGSGVDLRDSFVAFAPHTAVATAAGALAWYWTPATFWWYLPLLSGLVVAIVLCWFTSNPARGLDARRRGLFLVPSESVGLPILRRVEAILADPRTGLGALGNGAGDTGTLQRA
jgi:membrane glycosyltransferase